MLIQLSCMHRLIQKREALDTQFRDPLSYNKYLTKSTFLPDRLLLHDQPLPRRHSHPVLRDEEARDGAHAARTRPLPEQQHPGLIHQQQRAHQLLRGDRQVHRASLA